MVRGTIFLAMMASVALAGAAHAQDEVSTQETYRILISDLDFSTSAGKATFDRRVERVAQENCSTLNTSFTEGDYAACRNDMHAQANQKLDLVLAQRSGAASQGAK